MHADCVDQDPYRGWLCGFHIVRLFVRLGGQFLHGLLSGWILEVPGIHWLCLMLMMWSDIVGCSSVLEWLHGERVILRRMTCYVCYEGGLQTSVVVHEVLLIIRCRKMFPVIRLYGNERRSVQAQARS